MAPRKPAVHPLQALADAREAETAAAAEKAKRAPHTLSEAEALLIPGKTLLELGNAGKLTHLGLGLPVKLAAVPKTRASRPAKALLTDNDLKKMPGAAISKAMAAGRVAGIGPRRRRR